MLDSVGSLMSVEGTTLVGFPPAAFERKTQRKEEITAFYFADVQTKNEEGRRKEGVWDQVK